jgi:hypothetical protein
VSWAVIEVDGNGVRETRRGGTLTGEPEPKPEPEPKLVTWRLCVRIQPWEVDERTLYVKWYRSGDIPDRWYPIESHTQPIETVQQLPEGQEP